MDVKGMAPRYAYTDNSYGIKLNDYLNVKQEFKRENNVKFTLPKRDTYYSTDKFIQVPLTYNSTDMFNGFYLAHNNVVKPIEPIHKISDIESCNQVDFRSCEWIKLGEYNGVTIEIKGNKNGQDLDTNMVIPDELSAKPGQPATEFEKRVSEMCKKLSDSQREEIDNITGAFEEFCKVAGDEKDISAIDGRHHKDLILGLEKMGVDLSKPFAINGEEFYLRNDTGKIDYYNVKKYVIREDGRVEIQDARNDNPSDVWKELAEKFNVQNASFDDIKDISMQLYNAGQINGFECAMLAFDPSESPQSIKPNLFLTQADTNGKRDWISEYEARSAQNLEMGNLQSYKNNQRTLEILKKLL